MKLILAISLALAPAAAFADTIALTPAQAEAAKEAGAARNAQAARLGQEPVRDRAVHGEVGVAIGTGGYSAIFGTAAVPLGEDGLAVISVANEDYGRSRLRGRRSR